MKSLNAFNLALDGPMSFFESFNLASGGLLKSFFGSFTLK